MIEIVAFDRRYDRSGFESGQPSLDEWLVRQSGQSERRDTTRTFLAIDRSEDAVVGFYATKTYELDLDEAAAAFGVGRRKYPIPAILLARLAIDRRHQGRGLGRVLLVDALERMSSVSESVGFEVVVVDAIDAQAATFYRRFGFSAFDDDPLHLFMTTKDLRTTFAQLE